MTDFLEIVRERMSIKGDEHDTNQFDFAAYCPLGIKSASTLVHREALRVCACAEKGDVAGFLDHLIDTAVFATLAFTHAVKGDFE